MARQYRADDFEQNGCAYNQRQENLLVLGKFCPCGQRHAYCNSRLGQKCRTDPALRGLACATDFRADIPTQKFAKRTRYEVDSSDQTDAGQGFERQSGTCQGEKDGEKYPLDACNRVKRPFVVFRQIHDHTTHHDGGNQIRNIQPECQAATQKDQGYRLNQNWLTGF